MKRFAVAVIVCLVMASLVMPAAGQLARSIEKAVFPGVTTIQYGGQTLVFNSSSYLRVNLRMVSETQIELTVRTVATEVPPQETYGTAALVIDWKNFNSTVYDGLPPSMPWTGLLDTEAGWTEK